MVFVVTPITSRYTSTNDRIKHTLNPTKEETFYNGLKPFALICKVVGVFSPQNVIQNDGRLLKHSLLSLHSFWGTFIVGITTILNTYFETENFLSHMAMFYIARGISIPLLSVYYDKYLPELVFRIEEFNITIRSYINEAPNKRNLNTHGRLILYISSIGYIILMGANVTVLSIINDYKFPQIGNKICDSFTFLTRQFFVIMYIYFCYNIKLILCSIRRIWRQNIQTSEINKPGEPTSLEEKFEIIRLLHAEVVQTVELLNTAYGLRLLFYITIYCTEVLLSLYEYVYRQAHFKLYFIIYSALTLYMVSKFTEDITTQVSFIFYFIRTTEELKLIEVFSYLINFHNLLLKI
jgi:hypothetical protein